MEGSGRIKRATCFSDAVAALHYFEYKNDGFDESKWPYDKPFYLILNVAVGGAWGSVKGIDEEAFPQTMEIDYVRIYQMSE